MLEKINKIEIKNFKSIRDQTIDLKSINILIGPNGSGKSNFLNYFNFVEKLNDQQLDDYVFKSGGVETFLFGGYPRSNFLSSEINFDIGQKEKSFFYKFSIIASLEKFKIKEENNFQFFDEEVGWYSNDKNELVYKYNRKLNNNSSEAQLKTEQKATDNGQYIYNFLNGLRLYHFDNVNTDSRIRQLEDLEDNIFFKKEGENLASFLLLLREKYFDEFNTIIDAIKLVYPTFHDFVLEESRKAKGKLLLRWREKGDDNIYNVRQISDGTLRFICLATLLLQPQDYEFAKSPSIIIIDEPELGLHPFAIHVLSELIKKASTKKQIIIATQSIELINEFEVDDLIITERNTEGETIFKRKTKEEISEWLKDYTLGEIWESNILGGRP